MQTKQDNADNIELVDALIARWEDETVEFKEAGKDYSTDKIGRYVSALSNEANLAGLDSAWLVFGIRNKDREVVGSEYRSGGNHLSQIKRQVFDGTIPNLALLSV